MTCEYVVQRAAANLPQSTTQTLFTVTGGKVLLLGMVGKVTATVQSQANNTSVIFGATEELTPFSTDLSGAVAGSLLGLNASGISTIAVEVLRPFPAAPVVLDSGVGVLLSCSASNTGQVAWTLWYRPLDPGAAVS